MPQELIQKTRELEAILFYVGEPVSFETLSRILDIPEIDIATIISHYTQSLASRGLSVVIHENSIGLVTAPDVAPIVEKIVKDERERELGKASIETLAIVAYKGPISRKEIEYIRGVNSQFALRNLLLRGLIEKKTDNPSERSAQYTITGETLQYLGLSHISELPEYTEVTQKLEIDDSIETDADQ